MKKYNRLTIVKTTQKMSNRGWNETYAECVCECGNKKELLLSTVKAGIIKSCGCLQRDRLKEVATKHGESRRGKRTLTYNSWSSLRDRCNNKNSKDNKTYIERGIKVCKRWNKYENFLKDMGKRPSKEYSIDRIDNNKGYFKENCKWSTFTEQMNNTTRTHWIEYRGQKQSLAEWCKELDMNYSTVATRMHRGWTEERALTTPTTNSFKNT